MSPFAAAEYGAIGLTQAAALDYATQGIRVNAIAPGLIATPMTKRRLEAPKSAPHSWPTARSVVLECPRKIAGTVLRLLSDASSFTTGATMVANGGQTATQALRWSSPNPQRGILRLADSVRFHPWQGLTTTSGIPSTGRCPRCCFF
jgi:short-subunit dehydrogenase